MMEQLGKITVCIRAKNRIIVEGWVLPKADRVEILWENTLLGEARIGLGNSGLLRSYPEYKEQNDGWIFGIDDPDHKIYQIKANIFEGSKLVLSLCAVVSDELSVKRGHISYCCYNEFSHELRIKGWYLPKPDDVEIWAGDRKLGHAETNQKSPGLLKKYGEYGEENGCWSFRETLNEFSETSIIIKVRYGTQITVKEEVPIVIDVPKVVSCDARITMCIRTKNRIVVEGWALPKADTVEIWGESILLGEARTGLDSSGLLRSYPEYKEKNGSWIFGIDDPDHKIHSITAKILWEDKPGISLCAVVSDELSVKRGHVSYCHYNEFSQELKIKGWYLPKPDDVEIWAGSRKLGRAEMNQKSLALIKKYWEYGEEHCGWSFRTNIIGFCEKSLTVKVRFGNKTMVSEEIQITNDDPKVVSFDVFDTLLVRPAINPTDMFKIVALRLGYHKCFQQMRIAAEQLARKRAADEKEDITIEDIYSELRMLFNMDDAETQLLMNTEMQVERDYLRARKSVKKLFDRAKECGKEIIIISDMYLPYQFIYDVLIENGYSGFHKLYISGEEKVAKGTGKLYEKIFQEYQKRGISCHQILHIGDNGKTDIVIPEKYGCQTFHTPKTIDLFRQSVLLDHYIRSMKAEMDNSFIAGFLANYLFDDPFSDYDYENLLIKDLEKGVALFAPFLFEYTLWMLRKIDEEGIEDILLTYRDGYLINKIMDVIAPYWEKSYRIDNLYLSRTIRYNGYCKSRFGLIEALVEYHLNGMTIRDFVKKRLLVDDADEANIIIEKICQVLGKEPDDRIESFNEVALIWTDIDSIYKNNAKRNMEIIEEYCINQYSGRKTAVFDIGYRGKTVDFLITNCGMECVGYQMFAYSLNDKHEEGCRNVHTYIKYGFKTVNQLHILHHLFEDILCVQEGTASKIIKNDDEFIVEKESSAYRQDIERIQQGLLDFIEKFVGMFKFDISLLEFERYPEFDMICEFLLNPGIKDAEIISNLSFQDSEFIGKPGENAYKDWYTDVKSSK